LHGAQEIGHAASAFDATGDAPRVARHLAGSLTALATTLEKLTSKIDSLERPSSPPALPFTASSQTQAQTLARTDNSESSSSRKRRKTDHDPSALNPFSLTTPSGQSSKCIYTQLPTELLHDVVQLYFIKIHSWIPILHWTRFKHKYRHGALGDKMGTILNALIVSTLKYVDRDRYRLSDADVHRMSMECRDLVLLRAMDSLCVENLQALVIIAFLDVSLFQNSHERC
jgi:hypothetical protein